MLHQHKTHPPKKNKQKPPTNNKQTKTINQKTHKNYLVTSRHLSEKLGKHFLVYTYIYFFFIFICVCSSTMNYYTAQQEQIWTWRSRIDAENRGYSVHFHGSMDFCGPWAECPFITEFVSFHSKGIPSLYSKRSSQVCQVEVIRR